MRSNQVYGKFFAVIAILSFFLCGPTATSVANVTEGETKRHDTSAKGDNADSHPVGDLTIAGGKQLLGDDIGILQNTKKGRGHKAKKLKTKSKTKNGRGTTGDPYIFENKVHGSFDDQLKSKGRSRTPRADQGKGEQWSTSGDADDRPTEE